jgi:hypothetical protein
MGNKQDKGGAMPQLFLDNKLGNSFKSRVAGMPRYADSSSSRFTAMDILKKLLYYYHEIDKGITTEGIKKNRRLKSSASQMSTPLLKSNKSSENPFEESYELMNVNR